MLPNMVERPRQKSMMKNRADHRGEIGIFVMASVKTMKANPVPSTPWEKKKTQLSARFWYGQRNSTNKSYITEESPQVAGVEVQAFNDL